MDIIELESSLRKPLLEALVSLWEGSVRATHDFLSEKDIVFLRPLVLNNISDVKTLFCIMEDGAPVAFLGMEDRHIAMLFVAAGYRGRGLGKALMIRALEAGVETVDVNEQNTQACGFYRHMGFVEQRRDPVDSLGLPFPTLRLRRWKN